MSCGRDEVEQGCSRHGGAEGRRGGGGVDVILQIAIVSDKHKTSSAEKDPGNF